MSGGAPILTTTIAVSVFGSRFVVSLVAAALVCTGTVSWLLDHWRAFTS